MKLGDFHHQISGPKDAPWIIFLHGLLGSGGNWRRITPAFEEKCRVLTYDQRGHGRSFKPDSGYRPEDFAGDLSFLMTELQIPKAFIVGHSMGGRNALHFAFQYPQKVEKLVLEDIGPGPSPENGARLIQKLKNIPVPFRDRIAMKEYFLGPFGDPKFGAFLAMSMAVGLNESVDWAVNFQNIISIIEQGRLESLWKEFEELKCPTLIMRGDRSGDLSHEEFKQMLARNSNAEGIEIKNSGHWIHAEQPEAFIEAVRDFL